eukprot:3328841-Amphidinium_carterae.1
MQDLLDSNNVETIFEKDVVKSITLPNERVASTLAARDERERERVMPREKPVSARVAAGGVLRTQALGMFSKSIHRRVVQGPRDICYENSQGVDCPQARGILT